MKHSLVTVYIATHNRPDMLRRAVNSVYAQSYKSIEIIVVDDGSTPSAENELKEDIAEGRLTFIRNEQPRGACHARNRAVKAATGEFITGLDDDDEFLPHRVETLHKAFAQPGTSFSCVASCITEQTKAGRIARRYDSGTITLDMMLHYNFLGNQVFTKTEYLREAGAFDEDMPAFQDYDAWLRLVEKFGPALKIDDTSYIWHTAHEAQRITGSSAKRLKAYERFLQKHRQKMSSTHLKSMELIRKKIQGEPVGFKDALNLCNRYNRTSVLALLMEHRLKPLKNLINAFRVR